jgi:hypothetical protein
MYRVKTGSSPASQLRSAPGNTSTTTRGPQTPDTSLAETSTVQDAPSEDSEISEDHPGGEYGQALREAYEHGSIRDILLAQLEQDRRNGCEPGSPQQSTATDPSTTTKEPTDEKDRRKREKLAEKEAKNNEKAREKAMEDNAKIREKKLKARAKEAKAREKEAKELKKAAEKERVQGDKSRRRFVAASNRQRNDSPIAFSGDVRSPPTKEEEKAAKKSASEKHDH